MAKTLKQHLEYECDSCSGTGLYCGFAEPKGTAVVCIRCNGTGKAVFEYRPFEGRHPRKGVQIVCRSGGSFIATGVGPVGGSISYAEFQSGRLP